MPELGVPESDVAGRPGRVVPADCDERHRDEQHAARGASLRERTQRCEEPVDRLGLAGHGAMIAETHRPPHHARARPHPARTGRNAFATGRDQIGPGATHRYALTILREAANLRPSRAGPARAAGRWMARCASDEDSSSAGRGGRPAPGGGARSRRGGRRRHHRHRRYGLAAHVDRSGAC